MTDIVERMRSENMVWSVSEAADEIERLRSALNQIIAEMEYEPGNGGIALKIAKQAMEAK